MLKINAKLILLEQAYPATTPMVNKSVISNICGRLGGSYRGAQGLTNEGCCRTPQ